MIKKPFHSEPEVEPATPAGTQKEEDGPILSAERSFEQHTDKY